MGSKKSGRRGARKMTPKQRLEAVRAVIESHHRRGIIAKVARAYGVSHQYISRLVSQDTDN